MPCAGSAATLGGMMGGKDPAVPTRLSQLTTRVQKNSICQFENSYTSAEAQQISLKSS
jgi:hypothetical protein